MAPAPETKRSRVRSAAVLVAGNLAVLVAVVIVAEGVSSTLLFSKAIWDRAVLARREGLGHTQFDPLLGWSAIPNSTFVDLYGPGRTLTTNSQGFRAREEYAREVTEGRLRVICSGDSYTLGHGVGDDQPWCHVLQLLDPRLQTVNMGQAGYGFDQAYLWYTRDGADLDHDVQLLSYIQTDFERMRWPTFQSHPKPVLGLLEGRLQAVNTPLQELSWIRWFASRVVSRSHRGLQSAELVRTARRALDSSAEADYPIGERATFALFEAMLDDLQERNRIKNSQLVVVALPALTNFARPDDYRGTVTDTITEAIAQACQVRGIPFLNLIQEFRRRLTFEQNEALYDGHYNVAGNRFVAELIHELLLERGVLDPPASAEVVLEYAVHSRRQRARPIARAIPAALSGLRALID